MDDTSKTLCADDELMEAVALADRDDEAGFVRVAALCGEHPGDPRLQFLHGSLLAGRSLFAEAHVAMARAVEIAPDYAIARFQLGLLELSSGDAVAADATFAPLAEHPSDDALVLFARGLRHLARDETAAAVALLREGIEVNHAHPLVSRDMGLIIAKIEEGPSPPAAPAADDEEDLSAAHLLLRQYADKGTRH